MSKPLLFNSIKRSKFDALAEKDKNYLIKEDEGYSVYVNNLENTKDVGGDFTVVYVENDGTYSAEDLDGNALTLDDILNVVWSGKKVSAMTYDIDDVGITIWNLTQYSKKDASTKAIKLFWISIMIKEPHSIPKVCKTNNKLIQYNL